MYPTILAPTLRCRVIGPSGRLQPVTRCTSYLTTLIGPFQGPLCLLVDHLLSTLLSLILPGPLGRTLLSLLLTSRFRPLKNVQGSLRQVSPTSRFGAATTSLTTLTRLHDNKHNNLVSIMCSGIITTNQALLLFTRPLWADTQGPGP